MMSKRCKQLPSLKKLNDNFFYDEKEGILRFTNKCGSPEKIYTPAGRLQNSEYLTCSFESKIYYEHRLIYKMICLLYTSPSPRD